VAFSRAEQTIPNEAGVYYATNDENAGRPMLTMEPYLASAYVGNDSTMGYLDDPDAYFGNLEPTRTPLLPLHT